MTIRLRRVLTAEERLCLGIVRDLYGTIAREENVVFHDISGSTSEACLWLRDTEQASPLVVNLSFLARMRREGAGLSDIERWISADKPDWFATGESGLH